MGEDGSPPQPYPYPLRNVLGCGGLVPVLEELRVASAEGEARPQEGYLLPHVSGHSVGVVIPFLRVHPFRVGTGGGKAQSEGSGQHPVVGDTSAHGGGFGFLQGEQTRALTQRPAVRKSVAEVLREGVVVRIDHAPVLVEVGRDVHDEPAARCVGEAGALRVEFVSSDERLVVAGSGAEVPRLSRETQIHAEPLAPVEVGVEGREGPRAYLRVGGGEPVPSARVAEGGYALLCLVVVIDALNDGVDVRFVLGEGQIKVSPCEGYGASSGVYLCIDVLLKGPRYYPRWHIGPGGIQMYGQERSPQKAQVQIVAEPF